jgi:cardiolipin synthase A/B
VINLRGVFPISIVALCAALVLAGCRGPHVEIRKPVVVTEAVTNAVFRNSLAGYLGNSFVEGNRITRLRNGDEIFPAMLKAIAAATNTISFENYIWDSGRVSDRFIAVLTERARAGVEVRVITDALGSEIDPGDVRLLRKHGVKYRSYNRLRLHNPLSYNVRNHHKILVVDGAVGFTGGVCIADEWSGNARYKDEWRDTHFRVEGPVVAQLQRAFASSWLRTDGEVLFGEKFYPTIEPQGDALAQAFHSSAEGPREATRGVFLASIAAARKSIRIAHSYFVPDGLSRRALVEARQRGVRVEIIVPSTIDAAVVRSAGRSLWPDLLRAGVEIHEYGPAMYHCKILIIDDVFVVAGSSNFDERSFHINEEANINVLNATLAQVLIADFEQDKAQSKHITYEDFKRTPWYQRTYEWMWGLLRSQF